MKKRRAEKWEEMKCEGQIAAELVIEFIIKDSQVVDVKAKFAKQNYRFN